MADKFDGQKFLFSHDCGFSNDESADTIRCSDGSVFYSGADGSDGYIFSDGSAHYFGADGSEGYKYMDGSGYFRGTDGSEGCKYSDGSGYFKYADGRRYEFKKRTFMREHQRSNTIDYKAFLIGIATCLLGVLISLGMFFYFELKG